MTKLLDFIRTTIIGGAIFLLPLFVLWFVLAKAMGLVSVVADPVVEWLGVERIAGIGVRTIVTIIGLALGAFLAGLLARTRAAQTFLRWIQAGMVATMPQFGLLQTMAHSFDRGGGEADVPVVLVPTDAGWALGLLLEPRHGDWFSVFLPGSPQFMSGSIAFAHVDQVHSVNMTVGQLWAIMRGHGSGSSFICERLEELRKSGALDDPTPVTLAGRDNLRADLIG